MRIFLYIIFGIIGLLVVVSIFTPDPRNFRVSLKKLEKLLHQKNYLSLI